MESIIGILIITLFNILCYHKGKSDAIEKMIRCGFIEIKTSKNGVNFTKLFEIKERKH